MGTFENTDFSWAEGWDFGVADQLFSTVTDTVSLQGDRTDVDRAILG
jgi:hypothetical protein